MTEVDKRGAPADGDPDPHTVTQGAAGTKEPDRSDLRPDRKSEREPGDGGGEHRAKVLNKSPPPR